MPPAEPCAHCPLRADPEVPCVVRATGHAPFCAGVDPADPRYHPRMAARVRALSYEQAGKIPPAEPDLEPPPVAPHQADSTVPALPSPAPADDPEHFRILRAAELCEYRKPGT